MSNVEQSPVPLVFNERFLYAFLDEDAPCAALGLVEEAHQVKGFVAARLSESLSRYSVSAGFDFGFGILGNKSYQIMHFMLAFQGLRPYDILLNPNNPVVRRVIDVVRETGEYFFFVFESGGMLAFQKSMDETAQDRFYRYGNVVHTATTTEEEYARGLRHATGNSGLLRGELLDWVCREDTACLDLRQDRFEVHSS